MKAPRPTRPQLSGPLVMVGAAVAVGLSGLILFAAAGAPPVAAMATLLSEPLSSATGLSETLLRATPLILCTLSVSVALRVGLWNLGGEGQLAMGAFAATGVALFAGSPPGPIGPLLALGAGAMAGALWAAVPALLRVRLGLSEILSTLMLNYVALAWVELLVFGPWKGTDNFPYTAIIDERWQLPLLFGRSHSGLALAVGLSIGLSWIFRNTVLGFHAKVVGASEPAARAAGLPVDRLRVGAFCVAGALAGLAGASELLGVEHRLHAGMSPGYGYTALLAAFLARARPLYGMLAAVLLAGLAVGGEAVQVSYPGVSASVVLVFQGLLLLFVLIGDTLRRRSEAA